MAIATYETLSDSSRLWIYRADRVLNDDEVAKINSWLTKFINQWTAHNQTLKAFGTIYHSRFITIFLDEENSSQASGCSIDSQVRFIQDMGNALNVDFFDRLHFDFMVEDGILTYHKDDVTTKIQDGDISEDTMVMDHLVKTKKQFEDSWLVPLSQSWHKRLI
jgi:hypothetical protein